MTDTDAQTTTSGAASGDGAAPPAASGHASAPDPAVSPGRPHGDRGRGAPGWFAGLDGLRAIAAFGVLVTHVALASGYYRRGGLAGEVAARGEVGVALFFVLSGFLLYRPFVSARFDSRPAPRLQRYLRHRVLRIFPAYWLALTVLAVVFSTRPDRNDFRWPWDDAGGSLWDFAMYYGLLQSFSERTALGGLQQAWTLHNEVMFYLLLPFWAVGAAWLARRFQLRNALRVELGILAGAAVACLAWRMWVQSVRTSTAVEDFDPRLHWLIGNFHMFAPGMALALGLEWARRREQPVRVLELIRAHPLVCWALAGLSFWAVSTQIGLGTQVGAESPLQDLGKETLYASVGFFLVAPVALAASQLPRSLGWLSTRVMVTLGLLSYGIYLWHVGVIDTYLRATDRTFFTGSPVVQMFAAAVIGSIAVAGISYVVVERPALKLKDRKPRDRSVSHGAGAAHEGTGAR